jgi:hypothetical protein
MVDTGDSLIPALDAVELYDPLTEETTPERVKEYEEYPLDCMYRGVYDANNELTGYVRDMSLLDAMEFEKLVTSGLADDKKKRAPLSLFSHSYEFESVHKAEATNAILTDTEDSLK